jgi:transcriptional antiterminator NusG
MSKLNWYVLRAVAGQEKKVKNYIDNEIARQKLEEFVPQVLIPTEKVYEVRNGKKKVREKSFFPGYILIYADLSHGEAMHTLKNIPGVLGFLEGTAREDEQDTQGKKGYSKQPLPLRQSEVNRILGKVDEEAESVAKMESSFIVGEHVRVIDGPFSGFDAVVEQVFDERKKLNVMVKVFGRSTPLELSYVQVEKID